MNTIDMKTNSLISIIIGVYNVERYLERGLESIIKQTYKNLQIIVIDDESTDSSWDICKKYSAIDNRIELFRIAHKGLASVRNLGIERAKGEYLAFFDPDDFVDEDYISTLYDLVIENNVKISVCNAYRENLDGKVYVKDTNQRIVFSSEDLFKHMMLHCSFGVWDKLWHKSLFENFRFNEEIRCGSDLDTYKMIFKEKHVAYYSQAKYHYQFNSLSLSHSVSLDNRLDRLIIVDEMVNYIKSNKIELLPYAYFLSCRTRRNFILSIPQNQETSQYITRELETIRETYPTCRFLFSYLERFTFQLLLHCPLAFKGIIMPILHYI